LITVYDTRSLLEERRKSKVDSKIPYTVSGKSYETNKVIINGEMSVPRLHKPIGEMLTTGDGLKELTNKIVLDVELGREKNPILYKAIYELLSDQNFPRQFEAKWALSGSVVFLEHMEGEEIRFGSLRAEQGPTAFIKTYAAGFEYTKEMVEFNEKFNFELLNRSFGEAHNALLNHLHLSPLFQFAFEEKNQTAARYVDRNGEAIISEDEEVLKKSHYILSLRETFRKAIKDCEVEKRPATVLLVHPANKEDVLDALNRMVLGETTYRPLEIPELITYGGWTSQVGKRTYDYPAVPLNKAYLIRPKRGFKELIKKDLEIQSKDGDVSRLIEGQVIGYSMRGVFAAVEENVQEITLPQSFE
jgi:hypothetical protein